MSDFEAKVQRTIQAIQSQDASAIAADITQRRMDWLDRRLPELGNYQDFSPREAYELLFAEQMGLDLKELPIVSESANEVVWLSMNRCSLLEACQALGWDTRQVCRPMNEKATQAFFSRINPQLRFHRSYQEIRPYAPHCREWVSWVDFEAYLRIAIHEAQQARPEGNRSHGAVVVFEDRIIGQAHDTVELTEQDPNQHAAVKAIRRATSTKQDHDLCGAILFSTREPCPLCTSLAIEANLTTIVFGLSTPELVKLGITEPQLDARSIIEQSSCVIEVVGDILHDECSTLYQGG